MALIEDMGAYRANPKNWQCLYPAYINSNRTLKKGRRIPREQGVDNPTAQELAEVCMSLGLNHELQLSKHYSRELDREKWQLGRVKVQLLNEDNSPANETCPNKQSLMLYAATVIPKLKSRSKAAEQPSASTSGKGKGKKKKK